MHDTAIQQDNGILARILPDLIMNHSRARIFGAAILHFALLGRPNPEKALVCGLEMAPLQVLAVFITWFMVSRQLWLEKKD